MKTKNLRIKCSNCGYKNKVPFNGFFVEGEKYAVYSPRYPLELLRCERCRKVIEEGPTMSLFGEAFRMLYLKSLFEDFCKYLDGKLRWTESKDKEWTDSVLKFFGEKNKVEAIPYVEEFEHMRVDYIWRFNLDRYSICDIELAVEHEGQEKSIDTLVEEEIQHLIDLKAKNKVGIFYPRMGDEKELIEKIRNKIASQSSPFRIECEKYLIMLGYTTTKMGKRAMLFKGFIFDQNGTLQEQTEQTILQKPSIKT
jgi:hypothetical protein